MTAPPDQANLPLGLNVEPGADDDGWHIPPPVTLSDGTRVQLYKDGEALAAAMGVIEKARQLVCLQVYIYKSDETGRAFTELLAAKAKQGVTVYLLYDSFGSFKADRGMFQRIRRAGGHVAEFHPVRPWECHFGWRPGNRDHRKLLLVDHDIGGLGGVNIGNEYAGRWVAPNLDEITTYRRDTAIGLRGPAVRHLHKAFAAAWRYVHRGGPIRRAQFVHDIDTGRPTKGQRLGKQRQYLEYHPTPTPSHETDLGIFASVPTLSSPLRPYLRRLLESARQNVQLTMAYFAPDEEFLETLCNTARRGVRVELMIAGVIDQPILLVAARSFYERLLSAGVHVYERQGVMLHSKSITVDERLALVGSTNLDYRSIEFNLEISAVVRNAEFCRQMKQLFAHDVEHALRIDPQDWRERPMLDRFLQWSVSRARYLL
ncbi:MAG: phosphatidylserine/phosphatidylglycerophosphate/cardiolipin synthase family protein [Phycisphaerae bacterium]